MYTKVVEAEGESRLVFFARTDIKPGQELTYDYRSVRTTPPVLPNADRCITSAEQESSCPSVVNLVDCQCVCTKRKQSLGVCTAQTAQLPCIDA